MTAKIDPVCPNILPTEPFSARLNRKRRKVGPFSKRLSFAQLDLRTAEGRFAHDVKIALFAQLRASPTAAQQILIQMAALKLLRCELLCRKILTNDSIRDRADNHFLAWANSLRRDLEALGIEPAAANPPTFADIAADIAARRARGEAA